MTSSRAARSLVENTDASDSIPYSQIALFHGTAFMARKKIVLALDACPHDTYARMYVSHNKGDCAVINAGCNARSRTEITRGFDANGLPTSMPSA